ncbi:MAG: serine protease [Gemmataceae bacterium]|nr:serine protease [Gemmataceae bacterium]
MRLSRLVLAAVVLAGSVVPASANEIYTKVAPGTVLLLDESGWGSGVLIDVKNRLVVTAEHVIDSHLRKGSTKVHVLFPQRDKDNRILTNATFYKKRKQSLQIAGEIIYFDRTKDLALIRLERVPEGATAIPLAQSDPTPGDPVHVIGNSTLADGGAFGYSTGTVRNQHYYDKAAVSILGQGLSERVFYSLSHHAPSNQGDSGGPVVDNAGKLVGIISQGTTGGGGERQQVVDHSVHVREIRRMLQGIQQPSGNAFEIKAMLDSPGFDSFYLPVKRGQQLNCQIKGAGKSDLDLFVKDLEGRQKVKFGQRDFVDFQNLDMKTGATDQEQSAIVTEYTGQALVQVQNVDFKAKNEYTLTVRWSERPMSPFAYFRRLAANGTDEAKFAYETGKGKARVTIRGDGDTDLTVEVVDPQGNVVARGNDKTDYHELIFEPNVNGYYSVRVHNPGAIWNGYVLSTD